jgi:pimeloyl-ACP methyl ester carboxylesterase
MSTTDLQWQHPDGRRIGYAEWGARDGIPVIYCHGFPGSRLEARLADAAARELGIRLVAPDRPGFGRSSFVEGRRLADWPRDLAALADALGLARFRVVGVSGGGPYAIACGLQLRERIEAISLVCALGELRGDHPTDGMNAAAAASLQFYRRFPSIAHGTYLHAIGPFLKRFPNVIFRILVGHAVAADRAVLERPEVRDAVLASYNEAFRAGAAGPTHELGLLTGPWGLEPAQLRLPVQLWHGEADHTVPPAMGRRHASTIPGVEARFMPGEGHFSLIVRHMHDILASLAGRG